MPVNPSPGGRWSAASKSFAVPLLVMMAAAALALPLVVLVLQFPGL
jgi:hypothetical protein